MRSFELFSKREIEVDHFDPREKNAKIQRYSNLFPADRHCNGTKSDSWPTQEEENEGLRFINCCNEYDYGICIFEDPETHELVGTTPAARYHILTIDLNAPHLVKERTLRAQMLADINSPAYIKDVAKSAELIDVALDLKNAIGRLIPYIPPPPKEASTQDQSAASAG